MLLPEINLLYTEGFRAQALVNLLATKASEGTVVSTRNRVHVLTGGVVIR